MKSIVYVCCIMSISLMTLTTYAQDEAETFGMPVSEFPTPPLSESATAIVNYKLDYMDLNPGFNLIHIDQATGVKLLAYVKAKAAIYSLKALAPDSTSIPIRVEKSDDGCIFAIIGPDWVNTICSDHFTYDEDAEKKEDVKEKRRKEVDQAKKTDTENKVLSKIKAYEEQEAKVKKKKKKKKKK